VASLPAALNIYNVDEVLQRTRIYPNPTRGVSTIDNDLLYMEEVMLRDEAGNAIYTSKIRGSKGQFDITNAPSGSYFVIIKTNLGMVVKLIVKVY
jgi:hypothetical protein